MYAVTSTPLDSRTRATLRRAEFGFLGVMILTCKHTPFFCGQPCRAGCFGLRYCWVRGLRTNWLIVGIVRLSFPSTEGPRRPEARSQGYRAATRRRGVPGDHPPLQTGRRLITVVRAGGPVKVF